MLTISEKQERTRPCYKSEENVVNSKIWVGVDILVLGVGRRGGGEDIQTSRSDLGVLSTNFRSSLMAGDKVPLSDFSGGS